MVSAHCPTAAVPTLVHNHSWQNAAYTDQALAPGDAATCTGDDPHEDEDAWDEDGAVLVDGDEEEGGGGGGGCPMAGCAAGDRALPAQSTVDQALMAALPVRYNALRMLALSGRCVIVDEAHALTAFSQRISQRLLHWLGALGAPVVVLSATGPGQVAAELVYSYLAGADTSGPGCAPARLPCPTPACCSLTPPPPIRPSSITPPAPHTPSLPAAGTTAAKAAAVRPRGCCRGCGRRRWRAAADPGAGT
jgi:CRISPR-associated endonuclease/helicase Cas3